MRVILFPAVILLIMFSSPAISKEGAYYGLGLVQNIILSDDVDFVGDAFGPNLLVGYKFKSLGVEGEWVVSEHQGRVGFADVDFSGLSINFLFPILSRDSRGELYLLGGYGSYKFDLSNGNKLEGNGYNLGLGSDYYFDERAAQVLRVVYRFIDYDEANNAAFATPLDGDTFTVEIGLKYHFR